MDHRSLLMRMLDCYSSEDVRATLMELGDGPDLSIERPFGKLNLKWRAYGGTASNISTIGLATKPGKSLTERVTNAIDAVLEDRSVQSNSANRPESPRQAAQDWFGRPMSGPDTGLFQGMPASTDRRISVVLLPSGVEDRPTVDVLDAGSGIVPQDFQKTILSLQAGNKITKRYQIGAFGQGGSSTLAFADYVLIVSRCKREPTKCGFTVVRVLKLDASYKEDCYAYLATEDGEPFVAEVAQGERLELYKSEGDTTTPFLEYGTLVRHVSYRLSGISKSLQASPGNLYHYLHYSLFDPVLPFRVWDIRDPSRLRSEYVGGSRNRLLSRSNSAEGSGNVQVRHYRPMEYIVPAGGDTPCIGIEYWVVLAFRKQGESEDVLRANSAELFVQNGHPIVGTLNGQTQGELTAQLFKEIGLGLLARHAIVHIDASAADSRVRRELFATSREGFKEGPVLDSISTCLRRMLEEDEDLVLVEKELTERLAKRDIATTRDEVRQQVTRLLKDAGLQVTEPARTDVPGRGSAPSVTVKEPKVGYKTRDPLPTLPFPNVTFVRFASPPQHLELHLSDSELVLIETDADAEFDRRGWIGIASSDDALEIESKAPLSGGRVRWRLRPATGTVAGTTGSLRVFVNKPNGAQVSSTISFEVLPAVERPAKTSKAFIPPFEIAPITPTETEIWNVLWPNDLGDSNEQRRHAYKSQELDGKTWVYYSTVFPPYAETLNRLKTNSPELVSAFTTAYEVWIAYHAILQAQSDKQTAVDIDENQVDLLLDSQRSVVATMQVKQAQQYAELWKRGVAAANN